MKGTRGQLFTLEGVLASLVLIGGLVFALQATVLTPATAGQTEAPANATQLDSLLTNAAETGALTDTVVGDWSGDGYSGGPAQWYIDDYPGTRFGSMLEQTVGADTSVNVVVYYHESAGGPTKRQRLVYNGVPGNGAVRSSTVLLVYDREAPSNFYAPDIAPDSDEELHTVLEVEVVAWRQ